MSQTKGHCKVHNGSKDIIGCSVGPVIQPQTPSRSETFWTNVLLYPYRGTRLTPTVTYGYLLYSKHRATNHTVVASVGNHTTSVSCKMLTQTRGKTVQTEHKHAIGFDHSTIWRRSVLTSSLTLLVINGGKNPRKNKNRLSPAKTWVQF